jgi:hypothetical protein
MTLQTVVQQVWRVVRLGGVAALAAAIPATHVASGDHKAEVVAGSVAAVEALYRALVPPTEQAKLYTLYLNFKKFLNSSEGQAVVKVAEQNPVASDLAARAAQGIAEADQNSAAASKVS